VEKFKGALLVGALRLFALLPWRAVQAVGSAIGWIMWKTPNRSRDVVRINLAKCFPQMDPAERERLVGQSLKDIGKSLTESACAWIWPAQRSIDLVREVEGLDVLKDALASGKGVVGITSHLGNWEVLNHFYCSQCKPIIFYRPPKLKAVDDAEYARRWQSRRRVPACAAPARRFWLQSDPGSRARSHVQHRYCRVLRGDEQSRRALCRGVSEPVHVEHEALQETSAGRRALVLS
jgi:KDO2-lipid IV(A) lauroyltransferase